MNWKEFCLVVLFRINWEVPVDICSLPRYGFNQSLNRSGHCPEWRQTQRPTDHKRLDKTLSLSHQPMQLKLPSRNGSCKWWGLTLEHEKSLHINSFRRALVFTSQKHNKPLGFGTCQTYTAEPPYPKLKDWRSSLKNLYTSITASWNLEHVKLVNKLWICYLTELNTPK